MGYNMFMSKGQKGFAHLLIFAAVIALAVIGYAGWQIAKNHKSQPDTADTNKHQATSSELLYLKTIGWHIDNYDPATNHAGDMVFTHEDHDLSGTFNRIFGDFGTQDPRAANDPTKRNPQPTFILPLGTKVLSLVDGVVADVKGLYSGDSTIMVTSSGQLSSYIYETEHIVNPTVKAGDRVKAGQVIGDVSTHDSQYHPGFGIVEIGILHPGAGQAQHICPFHYLDSSVKADIQTKILNIHKAWMNYIGNQSLYDDAHAAEPGCYVNTPVNG